MKNILLPVGVLIVGVLLLLAFVPDSTTVRLGGTTNVNDLTVDSITIGSTAFKPLTATATWNPGSLGTSTLIASATSSNVTVTGAVVGNGCYGSITTATTSALLLCNVYVADTATLTLLNIGSSALDLATGTARATVTQH